jgi:DHA2 family multidrug resistance protein
MVTIITIGVVAQLDKARCTSPELKSRSMRHPTLRSAQSDNDEPGARTAIMLAAREALADPSDAFESLDRLLDRSGYSEDDVRATFGSMDDLAIALAERNAVVLSQPLLSGMRPGTLADVRDTLIAFGLGAWKEYATTLVGFVRMMMSEGTRNPPLKKRMYEAGPATVMMTLRKFLQEASERGILSIPDSRLYAEHVMGILREPLYQALMLSPATRPEEAAADHVKASLERFVQGCANVGRTTA